MLNSAECNEPTGSVVESGVSAARKHPGEQYCEMLEVQVSNVSNAVRMARSAQRRETICCCPSCHANRNGRRNLPFHRFEETLKRKAKL